jgi:hypothetical protein
LYIHIYIHTYIHMYSPPGGLNLHTTARCCTSCKYILMLYVYIIYSYTVLNKSIIHIYIRMYSPPGGLNVHTTARCCTSYKYILILYVSIIYSYTDLNKSIIVYTYMYIYEYKYLQGDWMYTRLLDDALAVSIYSYCMYALYTHTHI